MSLSTARSLRIFLVVLASASAVAPHMRRSTWQHLRRAQSLCRGAGSTPPATCRSGALDPGRATDGAAFGLVRWFALAARLAVFWSTTDEHLIRDRACVPWVGSVVRLCPTSLQLGGDRRIASGWGPAEVRLDARIRVCDYVDLPGGTHEDILRISLEF